MILTYCLTDEQNALVEMALPSPMLRVFDTDCLTNIIAIGAEEILIQADALSDDDTEMLFGYYDEICNCSSDTIIWLGGKQPPKHLQKYLKCYRDFSEIEGKLVGEVDLLITEGTTLSRTPSAPVMEQEWGHHSELYRNIKKTTYGDNLLNKLKDCGFVMMVRDNWKFRQIVPKFDTTQSIMLYSMWDGYRTKPGSTTPDFLSLAGTWETLHTSGHASPDDIALLIEKTDPDHIIPMHTEKPDMLKTLCPNRSIIVLRDGEEWNIL